MPLISDATKAAALMAFRRSCTESVLDLYRNTPITSKDGFGDTVAWALVDGGLLVRLAPIPPVEIPESVQIRGRAGYKTSHIAAVEFRVGDMLYNPLTESWWEVLALWGAPDGQGTLAHALVANPITTPPITVEE